MNPIIREAKEGDILSIIDMGQNVVRESPRYRTVDYNPQKVRELANILMDKEDGILLVAEKNGNQMGFFAGMIAPHFFGNNLVASDIAVYVLPFFRNGYTASKLINRFEEWAIEQGAAAIFLTVSTEIHHENTLKFYERLGYRQTGGCTVKEVGANAIPV